jgi:hypothetical protein
VFDPDKLFQPSLMLLVRPGAYPLVAHLKVASLVCSGYTREHKTRLERLAKDKQSSLLRKFLNTNKMGFITFALESNLIKRFFFVTDAATKIS